MKYRPGWAAVVIVAENAEEDLILRDLHRILNPAVAKISEDFRPALDHENLIGQEKSGYAKLTLPTGE